MLDQKDECSAPVRREALGLVARSTDPASVALIARAHIEGLQDVHY